MNATQPPAGPPSTRKAKILVIEDNPDQWALIKTAIDQTFGDVEPILATNVREVQVYLEECANNKRVCPKFILLDLYLPNREDGWQLLQDINTWSAKVTHLPVVMLSYSDRSEDIAQAYDRGVASYLVKPTDFAAWLSCFQTLKGYWWDTVSLPGRQRVH